MIPSIDDRLDSIARALAEVILPALPADRSMAIEQAHLVLAHVALVRRHLDLAPAFERREAAETIAVGRDLADMAEGGARTTAAADALRAALGVVSLDTPAAVRSVTTSVGEAIEALIGASLHDGGDAFRAASLRRVLDAGRAAATRDRAWNADCGFEAADSVLPPIDALTLDAGEGMER